MFPSTYDTPYYFPPSYFPEHGADAAPGSGIYYAPSYFPATYDAPTYFPGTVAGSAGTPPATPYASPLARLLCLVRDRRGAAAPAPDFLSALVAYWEATPALTAISPNPFFGIAPPGKSYPIARLTKVSSVTGAWNSLEQYVLLEDYQLSIYDINLDNVVNYGEAVIRAFDPIYEPGSLSFSNGYQLEFFQVNQALTKETNSARGASAWIYCQSYTYRATIHKTRAIGG